MVEKLSFEINITYDNFDVVIPDEVVKNALTQEEYDEKMNTME